MIENRPNNMSDRLYTLEAENAELRRKLVLYDASNAAVQDIKEMTRQISTNKEYAFFRNYFVGSDVISEFLTIDNTIEELVRKRVELSNIIKSKLKLYKKYSALCFLKEKMTTPGCKLALLLQMVGNGDKDNLLSIILEQNDKTLRAEDVLQFYYKLLEEIASKAQNKNAVWDEFTLSVLSDEEPPKNEKERNKREIRDNTIRNFYRKHGEKMFVPENMEVLKKNLQKVGIKIDEISDVRIKHIVKRR